MDREELGSILNNYFNKGGLDTLCFELGIDYRDFSSYLLKDRIAEFLVIVDQENKQSELEQIIKRDRHFLINETKKTINTDYQGLVLDNLDTIDRVTLLKLVSTEFTYAEIQTIAIDLEVNETTLVGRTKIERVRELIVQVEDRGDLPLMKQRIYEHYSGNNPIKACLPEKQEEKVPVEKFSRIIFENCTITELKKVSQKINVDFENITLLNDYYTDLVFYLVRRNQLSELVKELVLIRPTLPWTVYAEEFQSNQVQPKSFKEQIAYHFDEFELRGITFDMELNHENFKEFEHIKSVEYLLAYCEEQNVNDSLIAYLKTERPYVDWMF